MRITADTNLLVRTVVGDDETETRRAAAELGCASRVVVPLVALCELAWVLGSVYRYPKPDIAVALRAILETENVEVDRAPVEAGLLVLGAGGDFADGVIAASGAALGGEVFVSFDRDAVRRLGRLGVAAREPSAA